MSKLASRPIGKEICMAIGLDPATVGDFSINIPVNGMVTITATIIPKGEPFAKKLKEFVLHTTAVEMEKK